MAAKGKEGKSGAGPEAVEKGPKKAAPTRAAQSAAQAKGAAAADSVTEALPSSARAAKPRGAAKTPSESDTKSAPKAGPVKTAGPKASASAPAAKTPAAQAPASTPAAQAEAAAAENAPSKPSKSAAGKTGAAHPASKAARPKSAAKASPSSPSKEDPLHQNPSGAESSPKGGPAARGTAARTPASRAAAKAPAALGLEDLTIAVKRRGQEKTQVLRPKLFPADEAEHPFGFPDAAPVLPESYGLDRLVLMPKDPEYMFSYWEITPARLEEKARERKPDTEYRETMRIGWEAQSLFEPNFIFAAVRLDARKWYFAVPRVGRVYRVELGWLNGEGHFISILKSNPSEFPESWEAARERLSKSSQLLSYAVRHTGMLGASENLAAEATRTLNPLLQQPLANISSDTFSSSSWADAARSAEQRESGALPFAPGLPAPEALAEKAEGAIGAEGRQGPLFPASAADLVVEGRLQPGHRLRIEGRDIPVGVDGRFHFEFSSEKDEIHLDLIPDTGETRPLVLDLREPARD